MNLNSVQESAESHAMPDGSTPSPSAAIPRVRKMGFSFAEVPRRWFFDNVFVTARANALNMLFPAGERFSSERLVADIARRGTAAHYFEDTETIIDFLVGRAAPDDVILIMSNGGFDNIHERLLESL